MNGAGGKTIPLSVQGDHRNQTPPQAKLAQTVGLADTSIVFQGDPVFATVLTNTSGVTDPHPAVKVRIDDELVLLVRQTASNTWQVQRGIDSSVAALHANGATAKRVMPVVVSKTNTITPANSSGLYAVPGLLKKGIQETVLRCSPTIPYQTFTKSMSWSSPQVASTATTAGDGGLGIYMDGTPPAPAAQQPGDGKLHFHHSAIWLAMVQASMEIQYGRASSNGDMNPGNATLRVDLKDSSGTSKLHALLQAVVVASSSLGGGLTQTFSITSCAFRMSTGGATLLTIQPADVANGDYSLTLYTQFDISNALATPTQGIMTLTFAFLRVLDQETSEAA